MASMSKLSDATYLSGAFQLNDSSFRASLPCHFQCASLGLAVFASDLGPAFAYLGTITAAMVSWIACWLSID